MVGGEWEGKEVYGFVVFFEDGGLVVVLFEGGEELLECGVEVLLFFWGEVGEGGVFVDLGAVAEFFCVGAAHVEGGGEGSDNVFFSGGEEFLEGGVV